MKHRLFDIFAAIGQALTRARIAILLVGLTYALSVGVGMVMAHTGNLWAVSYRDGIVSQAQSSPILVALDQNNRWQAALLDFGANLFGAFATTVSGLSVIPPFPLIIYRGWVGGIVSITGDHVSRLADPPEAFYYLTTLLLQLIPYTLSGGAGVNIGLALFKAPAHYQGEKWWIVPKEAVRDAARIYALATPLFLLASVWEFFLR